MANIAITINGLDKITGMASRFPGISQRHIDKAIVRSIGEIDRETKPLTPVKTGRLRSSFIPIFRPFRGIYGSNVPYAAEIHDRYSPGTHYRRPSLNKQAVAGFLTIGAKKAEPEARRSFASALKAIVQDLAS